MSRITMLDLAKRRNGSKEVGLIEANIAYAPELQLFPARTIGGTSYHTLLRTGLPSVGFTNLNEGVAASKSTYENKLVECFPIRGRVEIDKAAVSADSPLSSLQTDESMGVTEAAMRAVGKQIYYGSASGAADSKGHIGLIDVVSSSMVVDAGGTTATTGSSVWFVKFGVKDVQIIFGNNTVLSLPPFREESLSDGTNTFDGWVSHLTGWVGLQCVNPNSIVRIRDLTADSGKGLTDALLASGLAKFPAGYVPDAIFMSRRSRTQLQAARSAVASLQLNGKQGTAAGGSIYAPTPTDYEGIPIIATDSIIDTEALS